jgi:hypothetical protein
MLIFSMALFTPTSLLWAHGDMLAVAIFFLILGALVALPLTLFVQLWLLRKYRAIERGNILVPILQIIAVTTAFSFVFRALNGQEMILKAFSPLLILLWLMGYAAVFIRFCWLESRNRRAAVYVGILGIFLFPILSVGFAFLISRSFSGP